MHQHLFEEVFVLEKRVLLCKLGVCVNFFEVPVVLVLNVVPIDHEVLHLDVFFPRLAARLELGRIE